MTTQEKLEQIVDGIDKTEIEYENGWWETSTGAEFGAKKKQELQALIDSAKREELESLPFAHDTMGFCEHFGKQFRPCAKCVVDKRLAELKQSEESEQ